MAKEWRLCAEWLVRCQILPPDHKVMELSSTVLDLALVLRDGVLICHLLNSLHPGAIDPKEFSQRPQMSQFLCQKNIRTFLQTCQTLFKMRPGDLFRPSDLFDMSVEFETVIRTLSVLSKTPLAVNSGISGFPSVDVAVSRDSDYQSMEELAAELPEHNEDMYDVVCATEEDEEEIYEDLCALRSSHVSVAQGTAEPKSKHDFCVKELVETEKNYVEALNLIVQHFILPLKPPVMLPKDHETMFKHIVDLHSTHAGFHSELKRACSVTSTAKKNHGISECFIRWKKQFLVYGDYCSNLPLAQGLIEEIAVKDPQLYQKIMLQQQNTHAGRFRLRDLLAVPMQRVLKYHLLLKEMIKQSDRVSPDKERLGDALDDMQDLALYVNEVKRDNEALELIIEIEHSILDLQMPPNMTLKNYGRLLKDGELRVKSHVDNKTRTRVVFLFDEVLLMCKERMLDKFRLQGAAYSYKNSLLLSQYTVQELSPPTRSKNDRWSFQFMLVTKDTTEVYNIWAKTQDLGRKWIDAIKLAQENVNPPGARDSDHNFIRYTFSEPTICDHCNKLLRGIFYQGYLCKVTGLKVHKECIVKVGKNSKAPQLQPKPGEDPGVAHSSGKWKAEYSYKGVPCPANGLSVLTFVMGDVIDVIRALDDDWWEGRIGAREGFFPSRYIKWEYERLSHIENRKVQVPAPVPDRRILVAPSAPDFSSSLWYVGCMTRQLAVEKLTPCRSGSYLIRDRQTESANGSVKHVTAEGYALSVKYGIAVKHIKILRDQKQYYLADCKLCPSIPELVQFYQENTLEVSFPELHTRLLYPYRGEALNPSEIRTATGATLSVMGYCVAQYDYSASQPSQLSLTSGQRVSIISKDGGDRGWWRGHADGRVGYFPKSYVVEEGIDNPA